MIENLKEHAILHDAYRQVLQAAKKEYRESLRFYGAAKTVVNNVSEESDSDSSNLRNEVYTQFAQTYLRLGMLLAREDTFAEVYENCVLEDSFNSRVSRPKIDRRKHETSANVAIREALSVYESLGELRKQESAYAHFQLACYQRDCCLKFLEQVQKKNDSSKGGNSFLHRVKKYASLAERNWQKSMDFYGPKTHPLMHLAILVERAALLLDLSNLLHSNLMESALTCMLEDRHVSEDTLSNDNLKICDNYWSQLQMLLKKMLSVALCPTTNKSSANSQQSALQDVSEVCYRVQSTASHARFVDILRATWSATSCSKSNSSVAHWACVKDNTSHNLIRKTSYLYVYRLVICAYFYGVLDLD
ncbi:hypothetical protein K7X08_004270 [Anisodus acutangulus]|uniref:Uncharacterized protein n=1 Tax=Anisodus acutangulus TaxID=402998 RepID=A0A9Q1MGZ2_9SOLA|nr:hypothetical protein K7X08_004270 [Anisodus acutangulus]